MNPVSKSYAHIQLYDSYSKMANLLASYEASPDTSHAINTAIKPPDNPSSIRRTYYRRQNSTHKRGMKLNPKTFMPDRLQSFVATHL